MARQVDGNVITGTAPGALGMHLRVKGPLTALVLAGLGAADEPVELGTLEKAAFAAGDVVPIRARNAPGTVKMVANGAIAANAVIYGAAAGQIATAVSGAPLGMTLEASTAAGDIIECMRY
jgi:hypothetical protein